MAFYDGIISIMIGIGVFFLNPLHWAFIVMSIFCISGGIYLIKEGWKYI